MYVTACPNRAVGMIDLNSTQRYIYRKHHQDSRHGINHIEKREEIYACSLSQACYVGQARMRPCPSCIFIDRFRAINDQQNERIIRWSEDGNTVVIVNEQELTTKLLPAFNITNYFSFTQQLEKLGFRRVEQGYEHSISDAKSPKVRSTQFEGTTERLCRHLLRIIKRSGPQTSQIYGRLALSQCRKCWRATTVYGLPQATYSLRAQDMVPRAVLFLVESTIGWSNEEENQRLRMRTEQFSD